MKKYGITELARLFDISTEAIRKYEAKGVIHSKRNAQNSFREYDTWDIAALLHARKYKQMGFSVSQTARLLNDMDMPSAISDLDQRCGELAAEIEEKQNLIHQLNEWRDELQDLQDQHCKYRIEYRPELVVCQLFDGFALSENTDYIDRVKEWMGYLPYSFLAVRYKKEDLREQNSMREGGICIAQEDRQRMCLTELPFTHLIPRRLCVSTMFPGRYDAPLGHKDFAAVMEFMEQNGYILTGDVVAKVFFSKKQDGRYTFYHKVWFPIDTL